MAKYRKKPVVVEAMQITWGGSLLDIINFVGDDTNILLRDEKGNLFINTLEGKMSVLINDYVIKGVNGEFYPCKPDIFEKTYEKVEE